MGKLSVIIPVLNEAPRLGSCLESVFAENPHEVLVIDGGSGDGSVQVAKDAGARVLEVSQGRANQLNVGAANASQEYFLFLHADSKLPKNYSTEVSRILSSAEVSLGAFTLKIDSDIYGIRSLEKLVQFRSKILKLPYGDQALFLRREVFEELGGFTSMPLLEDYDLVRRARKRGQIVISKSPVMTSGRRWEQLGVFRTTLINQMVLLGYYFGVPVEKLKKLYSRRE